MGGRDRGSLRVESGNFTTDRLLARIGHADRAIIFRAHAKDEARISQAAIVVKKRLGAALGWIAERQRDLERLANPKASIGQKKRIRATAGLTA